jgi:hypothetical protein
MRLIGNYNLKVLAENIDLVVLKLTKCSNVEIRNVFRRTGLIQVKAKTLDNISNIAEVTQIEKDTKFYINRIAII